MILYSIEDQDELKTVDANKAAAAVVC